ncbi:MAG: PD40 domain-containing protein [Fimbriimonadaceae bacterium]|nr:PD40 domain-containing protein [Fimbriimonadaceae bacterium]QYK55354.1 MAG: PD40 domain-containing protein [Fimbriimonadaceae bacterium]
MRHPALFVVVISPLLSLAQVDRPFMFTPDIHGDQVAFQSEGDIWIGDLSTGRAHRLTSDPGIETHPRFSPDGAIIAFRAQYDGVNDIYTIPVTGGPAKRLTYGARVSIPDDWTADGRGILYKSGILPTVSPVSSVPAEGGAPTLLPLEFASHVSPAPAGDRIAFTRFYRTYMAWFHYRGGVQNQIWTGDLSKNTFRQVTDLPGNNEFPCWLGDRIYFVNETNAKFTLMSVGAEGGKPVAVAGPYDMEVRQVQGDGKRLVYEKGRGLEMLDPATKKVREVVFRLDSDLRYTRPYRTPAENLATAARITPTGKRVLCESRGQIVSLPAEDGEARVWMAKDGVRLRKPNMSPDAKWVAFVSDEGGQPNLWVAKSDGTGARRLTTDRDGQITQFDWSPDSKWIVLQDSRGEIRMVDASSGTARAVATTMEPWNGVAVSFSPDSRWLAYHLPMLVADITQVYLYEVTSGKTTCVSDGSASDFAASFSTDGKYLAFLSTRQISLDYDPWQGILAASRPTIAVLLPLQADQASPFAAEDEDEKPKEDPKPAAKDEQKEEPKKEEAPSGPVTKIDLDGIADRKVELPVAAGNYSQIAVVGDRVLMAGDGRISFYDLKNKKQGTVTSGDGFQVSADGKKLLTGSGRVFRVVDVGANDAPGESGRVSFGNLTLAVNPRAEWDQIYWDAWRLSRDYFYVANMHGVDWDAIGKKYAAFLPSVRHRTELDELIRWMQSELGSSHQYRSPGDVQSDKRMKQNGYLGADLEPDASGYYRIKQLVRGDGFRTEERSPLLAPGLGVKEGMYLIEVAGMPAKVGSDFLSGLVGRAGQTVSIKVNDRPAAEGAKEVKVKPVGSEDRMRYLDWVRKNREYVAKASGGRIGYLHLSAMGNEDMADFLKQYAPAREKDGLIVDTRYNDGGWVQDFINRTLSLKLTGFFNQRNNPRGFTRQGNYFPGSIACLQNEFNISCGEEFPHRFRDLKTGPVIGRRTMGGEVGSSPGWPLVDGGAISVPNYGMYTLKEGWVIEGPGVEPDIDVPSDPNLFVKGIDPQIDAAVKWLLEDMKKNPPRRPLAPADPVIKRK